MESKSRPVPLLEIAGKAAATPSTKGNGSRASRESSWSTAFTLCLRTSLRPPGSETGSTASSSSSKSSRDFSPAPSSALCSFSTAALVVVSEKSSRESRPSRASSAVEVSPKLRAPLPPPIAEVESSSKASSVAIVALCPPPEKESRELSWLTAGLKKAGGS